MEKNPQKIEKNDWEMQGGTPVFVLHVNGQRDLKQA